MIPIQVDVRPEEIDGEAGKGRVGGELAGSDGSDDQVDGEGDRAGFGDAHAAVLPGAEKGLGAGFGPVGHRQYRSNLFGVEHVLEHDVAVPIELLRLVVGQHLERGPVRLPLEVEVPGVEAKVVDQIGHSQILLWPGAEEPGRDGQVMGTSVWR